jgi:putative DNA primase/helicase
LIFKENARFYWENGLPAIPLRTGAKIPALMAWQKFASVMPTPEQQADWLEAYAEGNIGLALGPQSGVVALDLDSIDPMVERVLQEFMPPTPWKRVGKKGAVFLFKYSGEKTYRVKDEHNNTVFELLSRGSQIVLPPSIHPDTGLPYTANAHLYDIVGSCVPLPADFEVRVRQRLIDAGIRLSSRGVTKVADWVPAGGRDSQMVAHAGILARAVTRGERTVLEAQHEIQQWVADFVEQVVGDPLDPAKAVSKLMEFIRRDVTEGGKALPVGWSDGLDNLDEVRAYFGEVIEEWSLDEIMTHIQERMTDLGPEDRLGKEALIEGVLLRLSKSENITAVGQGMVFKYISNISKGEVQVGALRKRMGELKGGDILGLDQTEIARGLLKEMAKQGEVRFEGNNFYRWYGSHWKEINEAEIHQAIAADFGHLPSAKKFTDHKGIFQLAGKLAAMPLTTSQTNGINFANGYLTTDMELRDHDPRYGCTYCLPYRYMPDGDAPAMFMSLLDSAWGEDEDYLDKVQALREAIAVTLFGVAPRFSRAICLKGIAHSGKSTVMKIVEGLIPSDASCRVPPADWSDRFMPAMMNKKLVNFCGELSEHRLISGAEFKSVVEGEPMSGQFKGTQIFTFRPECAHWFASNHLPRTRDSSAGFTRRWLFLTFNKPVTLGEKRTNLHLEILADEREAIVAWAAPAIQDIFRRQDYTTPSSHEAESNEVAASNNSVRLFLMAGELARGSEFFVNEQKLFAAYFSFCRINANAQPYSVKRFRNTMQDLQRDFNFTFELSTQDGSETAIYRGVGIPGRRLSLVS